MSLLPGGLISGNAVVRVESLTVSIDAATGKTVETYAALADDVAALVSQVSAARPDEMGNLRNKVTATLRTADASAARADVRYYVKATGAYGLTGIYLYPESAAVCGAAGEGVMGSAPSYRVAVSTVRTT